jgi:hypothetical protein
MRLLVIIGTRTAWRSRPVTCAEGRARHHGGDGGHRRLMPAEMGADDVDAGGFQGLRQRHDLVPGQAAFEHVHRRDAEDHDEALPTAARTRRTTSTAKRMRFSHGPPHWSVRRLVFCTRKVD